MRRRIGRALMFAGACAWSISAPGADSAGSPAEKAPTYMERLVAAEQDYANVAAGDKSARQAALQALAAERSWVGDTEGALDAWASMNPEFRRDASPAQPSAADLEYAASTLEGFAAQSALDTILRVAKNRQIVILNEAHHVPRHRAFGTRLALELRKLGFQYLAIETLTADRSTAELMQRGYPTWDDGWYSNEPIFGDFIRQVIGAGYVLVSYERKYLDSDKSRDWYSRIDAREEAQANNLQRVFAQNPEARMLVYVGYGHAYRGMSDEEGKPLALMAERLRTKTGIEPLILDQTHFIEPRLGTRNRVLVDTLFKASAAESAVLVSKSAPDDFFSFDRAKADMTVFHRPTQLVKGRAGWLAMQGYRKAHPILAKLLPAAGRRLVQAFYASEGSDAVPVDQVIVTAGKPAPVFMLPKGKYRYAFQE